MSYEEADAMIGTSDQPASLLDPVDREAHDWVMRFASGRADSTELEAFRRWSARDSAHAEAFARACRLWEGLGPAGQAHQLSSGSGIAAPTSRMSRRAVIGGALAASVTAGVYLGVRPPLGLWPSLSELAADYRTGIGEQRRIVLNAGPSVEMNTRTSIALRTAPDGAARIELISGEAAISVGPDMRHSFEVIAGTGRVIASNAAFNVRYEGDVVCATCVSGSLDVEHGTASTGLQAGEQVIYSRQQLGRVAPVDPEVVTAWKEGVLVFHATPLSEAVAEINRYRPGRIIVTDSSLGHRLFNARFRIENIGGVVAQIRQVFGASVTALPGGIVLLG